MLKQLFKGIFNIMLLRDGPQGLPYSILTLVILIIAAPLLASALSTKTALSVANNMIFIILVMGILLYFLHKFDRYVQTIMALICCSWVMAILYLLFVYGILLITAVAGYVKGVSIHNLWAIFSLKMEKDTLPLGVAVLLMFGSIALVIWGFVIDIFIIRKATDWGILLAIAVIFLMTLPSALVEKNYIDPHPIVSKKVEIKVGASPPVLPVNTVPLNK
ncbi:MAG: hypothetical protein ACK4PR_09990 [Gammaproteobacteria bacterium]